MLKRYLITLPALMIVAAVFVAPAQGSRPNIVILLADDLGHNDVSFNGGDIATPQIDRIAREGVRLTSFYACPMCSPTRAGLMTGRWPIRSGTMRAVIPPWRDYGLPTDEHTLADLCADAGYKHRACIGKWHLGHFRKKWHPTSRGFTHFYGHYNGAIDYFTHEREGEVDWHRNGEHVAEEGYATDLLGAEAARFVAGVPKGEPYLLYVPFNAPHSPFQATEADLAKHPSRKGKRRTLAAMITAMDRAVGRILDAIDERGDADDTFVLFFSDNGGVRNIGDNRPYRGAKLTPYEGGIRVCAAVRWPGGGLHGGEACDARIGYIDIYPTIKRMVGNPDTPDAKPLDGLDVLDALRGDATLPDRDWYTWEAQGVKREALAVNNDRWKLVVTGAGVLDSAKNRKIELFRIDRDPHETRDVASEFPDVVQRLMERAHAFRELRRADGVSAYGEGRKGFKAPKNWIINE